MTVQLGVNIWLIVGVSLFVIGLVFIGYWHHRDLNSDALDLTFPMGIMAALWPLCIVAAIVSLPFWLGVGVAEVVDRREWKRKRRRADEKEALVRLRASFDRSEPEWSILDEQIKSMA